MLFIAMISPFSPSFFSFLGYLMDAELCRLLLLFSRFTGKPLVLKTAAFKKEMEPIK